MCYATASIDGRTKRLNTTPFEREFSSQPLSRDPCLRLIQVVGARKLCQQLLHRHPRQSQLHSNQATARSLQQGRHRMWLFSVLRLSHTSPVSSPVSRLRFLAALPVCSYHQRDRDQNATKRLRPPPTEESKPKAPSESQECQRQVARKPWVHSRPGQAVLKPHSSNLRTTQQPRLSICQILSAQLG